MRTCLRVAGLSTVVVSVLVAAGSASAAPPNRVEICHIPPSNPENFHTISVGENALESHLAHGDFEGACNTHCATLCDDGNACTIDDGVDDCEQVGCPETPEVVDCDDSDLCTVDSCDSALGCINESAVSCDDGEECTLDTCEPTTGSCAYEPLASCEPDACSHGAPDASLLTGRWDGTSCASVIQSVLYAGAKGDLGSGNLWHGGVAPGPNDLAFMPNVAQATWSGTEALCGISGNHMVFLSLQQDLEVEEFWFREGHLVDNGHDLIVTGTWYDRVHNWTVEFNGSFHSPMGGNKYVNDYQIGRTSGFTIGGGVLWAPGDVIYGNILSYNVRSRWPDMTVTQVTGFGYDLSAGLTIENPDAVVYLGRSSAYEQSEIQLNWDAGPTTGDIDWTLRWRGYKVETLTCLYESGQLIIGTLPSNISAFDSATDIFYGGDGYTYVGFTQ